MSRGDELLGAGDPEGVDGAKTAETAESWIGEQARLLAHEEGFGL